MIVIPALRGDKIQEIAAFESTHLLLKKFEYWQPIRVTVSLVGREPLAVDFHMFLRPESKLNRQLLHRLYPEYEFLAVEVQAEETSIEKTPVSKISPRLS